jgi:hypothetical protein
MKITTYCLTCETYRPPAASARLVRLDGSLVTLFWCKTARLRSPGTSAGGRHPGRGPGDRSGSPPGPAGVFGPARAGSPLRALQRWEPHAACPLREATTRPRSNSPPLGTPVVPKGPGLIPSGTPPSRRPPDGFPEQPHLPDPPDHPVRIRDAQRRQASMRVL